MLVDLINQYSNETAGGAVNKNTDSLGKDDFLNLLVTQLKNQDPLEPMKNEEFIAQLAQFNSLEQMINLNKSFDTMLELQQMSYASTFIGKEVSWLDNDGNQQNGVVSEVFMTSDGPALNVGTGLIMSSDVISMKNAA